MTMKDNQNAASFDFESYTDKNVMECNIPGLEVCYKDIDCQILKDICVDEGSPEREINVIGSLNDKKPEILFLEAINDKVHFKDGEDSSLECNEKEENDGGDLVSEAKEEPSTDNSLHTDEANCGATGTSDISEKNIEQLPDQILNGEKDSESPDALSAEAGSNSKVESSIITFNFNSPEQVLIDNGDTASVDPNSTESTDITENVEEQLANIEDRNSNGSSAITSVQNVEIENSGSETSQNQSPDESKNAASSEDPVPISSQVVEPKVAQHVQGNSSGRASVANQFYRDAGEASFSAAASLITYSGPVAFSGSLSHRSDGSTTSAKSFAFPVLESEWNSSPVRMAKADRRQFRKQKSWRLGHLCCRF